MEITSISAVVLLLALIGYHARLEWVEGLAAYLCRLVRVASCPRWLPLVLSVLAVSILALPLVGAILLPAYRAQLLVLAAGGFLGDIFSTHIIPTWVTGVRSPALSTWWAYLLAGSGLVVYVTMHFQTFSSGMFIAGVGLFVVLWPVMLFLRAVTR